jgi:hypothetical protein
MLVNKSNVTYSSIVEIGEKITSLEKQNGDVFLKLHRGVIDVKSLDINCVKPNFNLNDIKLQQYSGNDGYSNLIETIKT